MALSREKLVNEIRKINDSEYADFIGWQGSFQSYCFIWANCIKTYAEDILPPTTELSSGEQQMASYLMSSGNVRGRIFEESIIQFCLGFIPGMLPTFTGVLPSSFLDLSSVYNIGYNGGSAEEVAEAMAEIIHNWFLQGTAINVNTGVTINWS